MDNIHIQINHQNEANMKDYSELSNKGEEEDELKDTLVYFTRENFILPVNERTIMMKKEKEKKAEEYQREIERLEEKKQLEERKNQELREKEAQEKFRLEERRKLKEKRRQEEQEELKQMNGEFGLLYQNFLSGRGLKEVFLSCMNLRPAQFRLLFKALEFNKGIKTLSINRKAMDDDEMDCLTEALLDNVNLEVLQVEDNNLGPASLGFLANVLSKNSNLSSLSLEGNNLTRDKTVPITMCDTRLKEMDMYNPFYFQKFADSLTSNSNLVYLNLANCNLMPKCGRILSEALEKNTSIIMVDLSRNPLLDSRDLIKIQAKLKKNFEHYKAERLEEYQERKYMRENYQSKRQKEKVLRDNNQVANRIRNKVKFEQEQKELMYMEEKEKLRREREIQIKKLDKDARIRGMKKKRKKKKKKKTL
jgi:hypothetical protein